MRNSPAEEYVLGVRGLDPATVERHRLGYAGPGTNIPGLERFNHHLVIPYLAADGHPVRFKFRSLDPTAEKRYDAPKGQPQRLFNVEAVTTGSDYLAITEGEIDCMSLSQLGVPTVGIAGVSAWKHHFPRLMEGFNRVVLFKDNDMDGSKTDVLEEAIRKDAPDMPLLAIVVPSPFKDINEALVAGAGDLIRQLATGRKAN